MISLRFRSLTKPIVKRKKHLQLKKIPYYITVPKEGTRLLMESVLVRIKGAHFFTKGQRKGLGVGGTPEPLFIIDTDVEENIVYTGQGKQHPALLRRGLLVAHDEVHWVREDLKIALGETLAVQARIRYRQPLEKATLYNEKEGLFVLFDNPQTAISEGQFVAWYAGEELLGSGVIS